MKNHLNILPKLASFDLKCYKMRWWLGLRPRPRWGSLRRSPRPPNRKRQRAFGARHSLFRVHFYISIPLSGPPYGIPGSATALRTRINIPEAFHSKSKPHLFLIHESREGLSNFRVAYSTKPVLTVCCSASLGVLMQHYKLHRAVLPQCQSQAWMKEEGDCKCLCCYRLNCKTAQIQPIPL